MEHRRRDRQTEWSADEDESSVISEQWLSLRGGSGVQSVGIDLFKIQSSTINKLGKPSSKLRAANARHVSLIHVKFYGSFVNGTDYFSILQV